MSRIGKAPITIPAGVSIKVEDGNTVNVSGPLGALKQKVSEYMKIEMEGSTLTVVSPSLEKIYNSLHGLTRTLINNMVVGVTQGYSKQLEIVGVGYRAVKTGSTLTLSVGYSHPIIFDEENGITFEVPNANTIIVKGIDKQRVGEIAAQIRKQRPPEPYLGKGIRYSGEYVRRKSGKSGS